MRQPIMQVARQKGKVYCYYLTMVPSGYFREDQVAISPVSGHAAHHSMALL